MPKRRFSTSSPRYPIGAGLLVLILLAGVGCDRAGGLSDDTVGAAEFWLSDPGGSIRFQKQTSGLDTGAVEGRPQIDIDLAARFQEIDGFGFSLTGGSAQHIHGMSSSARASLLSELFDHSGDHIGTSYLRVSIGASDLDASVFSYSDLPAGETDVSMERFSIDPDRTHLIPVLKEILQIRPDLKIMGSPWSPPVWMKTNGNSVGGSLKPEYHDAYAAYFVRYVQAMASEGIPIDAITVQNEPLHPGNNPSLLMLADQQAAFIKNSLGPAFQQAGLTTKIVIYDHNADRPDYPISILDDPAAKPYIDGSAFHLYGGEIDALSTVHEAHPDRNLYFTEQWIGAPGNFAENLKWHVQQLIIGATRNWSRTVIEWNLAADENQQPHTPGGCTRCLGAVTITGDSVTRNPAYYIIAHASKFARPGSVRVSSTLPAGLPNVAFVTPDQRLVLVVLNSGASPTSFSMVAGDQAFASSLAPGAVGTYVLPIPGGG